MTANSNDQDVYARILNEISRVIGVVDRDQLDALASLISTSHRVFVAGAGRSGFMVRSFAMRLMHLGIATFVVGDTTTPGITGRDLLLIGSGSGSTASLRAAAEKTRHIGAVVALITIDPQSPIAQLAELVVTIPAPSPKVERDVQWQSMQPMGALFEQCLLLVLEGVVVRLMQMRGADSDDMFQRHANLE